jgi:hypothetical protein
VISAAVTLVGNRCLARFGFGPDLKPYRHLVADPDPLDRRYGLVRDVSVAQKYGYHLTGSSGIPTASASPSGGRSYSAAEELVIHGGDGRGTPVTVNGLQVPPGGCFGQGQRAIGQDPDGQSVDALAYQLQGEVFARVLADPRVRASQRDWSTCMAASGYREADPKNVTVPGGDVVTGTPSAQEVGKAVADARCAQRARLWEVAQPVEVSLQGQAIQQHQQQLSAGRRMLDEQVRRAAAIAAGGVTTAGATG